MDENESKEEVPKGKHMSADTTKQEESGVLPVLNTQYYCKFLFFY